MSRAASWVLAVALGLSTHLAAAAADTVEPDVPRGAEASRNLDLAKLAGVVVNTFANSEPVFLPDGKTVLFNSTRDGVPQIYTAPYEPVDAEVSRVLHAGERIFSAQPTDDGRILFLSDQGGNRNFGIYALTLAGRGLTRLTPEEPLERDPPFLPAGVPGSMVYSARAAAEAGTRVYQQAIIAGSAATPPVLAYTEPGPGRLVDVAADGKSALLVRRLSPSQSTLMLVDLGAGAARPLYPPEGRAANVFDARFSADGGKVLVSTDGGEEQALVLALDPATGAETARYVETKPAVAFLRELAVSRAGGTLAVLVDAGNHTEIRLLDAATLKPRAPVRMPLGSGHLGGFSPDGKRLLLDWLTPNDPPDLWAIEVEYGAPRAMRRESRPLYATLQASIAVVPAVEGSAPIAVNLYLPPAPKKGPRPRMPVVVLVRDWPEWATSGGGRMGEQTSAQLRWSPWVRFLLSQGYAVVEPNVRGSLGFGRAFALAGSGAHRAEAAKDLEAVGRWLGSQPWADKSKLILAGFADGGTLSLLALAGAPDMWRAALIGNTPVSWKSWLRTTTAGLREVLKGELPEAEGDGASPILIADKIAAPIFVYQGGNDTLVPRSEAEQLVKALRERGALIEYMLGPNEGHSMERKEGIVAFLSRSLRFLEGQIAPSAAKTP